LTTSGPPPCASMVRAVAIDLPSSARPTMRAHCGIETMRWD
jgi:hypothetical protein